MRRRGRSDAHHDADNAEPVMAVPVWGTIQWMVLGRPGVEDQAGGDGEAEGGGFEEGRRSSGFRGWRRLVGLDDAVGLRAAEGEADDGADPEPRKGRPAVEVEKW